MRCRITRGLLKPARSISNVQNISFKPRDRVLTQHKHARCPHWKKSYHHQEQLAPENKRYSLHTSLNGGRKRREEVRDENSHSQYLWAMSWQSLSTLNSHNIWKDIFIPSTRNKNSFLSPLSEVSLWLRLPLQCPSLKLGPEFFFCLHF